MLTPDGFRYIAADPPAPFHLRWLVPALCRTSEARWTWAARLSTVLAAAAVGQLTGGTWQRQAAAALLFLSLPAVGFAVHHPVLVDMPAIAAATWCAVVGPPWATVALALLAGSINERGPMWAALFAWSPLPLVGLVVPAVTHLIRKPGPDPLEGREAAWACRHPLKAGLKSHAGKWQDPTIMLLPWGGCLAAVLTDDWRVPVVAAVAYAQLLVATDTVRLYQQAAPAVIAAALVSTPPVVWPALILATWFNPWRGIGNI